MNLTRSEKIEIQLNTVKKQWHETLKNVNVIVFLRDGEWKYQGKDVLAKIRKATPYEKELYQSEENGVDAVLTISQNKFLPMSVEQQTACLDHELSHLFFDPDKKEIQIIGHDVEEFATIIKRHGLWHPDLQHFSDTVKQTKLFDNPQYQETKETVLTKDTAKKVKELINEIPPEVSEATIIYEGHTAKLGTKGAEKVMDEFVKNTVEQVYPQTIETPKGKKVVFSEEQKKKVESELSF